MVDRGEHVIVAPVDEVSDPWMHEIRRRHDPIAAVVPGHVTLVYPFDAELDPAAVAHHVATAVAGTGPIAITLEGVSGAEHQYLRYDIKRGNDDLIALHDRLYTGPLARYLDVAESYHPHVTIGRIFDPIAWRRTLDALIGTAPRATAQIRRILSYRRFAHGTRMMDSTVDLDAAVQA
jgi:2'-5' RNA ligase